MFDAAPLQFVAHGFVPIATINGPIAGVFANGIVSVTRTGLGTTVILLDLGLPGGGTIDLEDVRLQLTPVFGPGFPVTIGGFAAFDVATGATKITVQTWNTAADLLVDSAYWFTVGRPAESLT